MLDFSNLNLIPGKSFDENEKRACCPFCKEKLGKEDTKYKLYINLESGLYYCFRCETKGIINNLEIDTKKENDFRIKRLYNNLNLLKNRNIQCSSEIYIDLFSEPINKNKHLISYKYLIDRGISDEDIKKWNIRTGKSYYDENDNLIKKWSGRIIFPYFEDGICTYATGRTYINSEPKYLNITSNKSVVVYNINNITNRTCILCEGIISAISAEKYSKSNITAVSVLGKFPSKAQLDLIRLKADTVYLSFDGDVSPDEIDKINNSLLKRKFKIYNVIVDGDKEDANSLKEKYKYYFDNARLVNR